MAIDGFELSSSNRDAYLLKLDSSGNTIYATQTSALLSGGRVERSLPQLGLTDDGEVILSGNFTGAIEVGDELLTSLGGQDGYVAKVNAVGDFVWARRMGGAGNDFAAGLALAPNGQVFVSGDYRDNASFGATVLISVSMVDAFVVSLDQASGDFLWVKPIYGAVRGPLGTDAAGNVYITGDILGSSQFIDCDPGTNKAILSKKSNLIDTFIAKWSPAGDFLNAWQMSPSTIRGIAVGADDAIHTTGALFSQQATFDIGTGYATLPVTSNRAALARTTQDRATIFGQVYGDFDRNGANNAGDAAYAGVTVYIDSNNNGKKDSNEPSDVTDAGGGFSFHHLTPGTYKVRVVLPSGTYLTTPSSLTITLAAGQGNSIAAFGIGRTPKSTIYSNTTTVSTSMSNPNAVSTLTINDFYPIRSLSLTLRVTNNSLKPLTINLIAPDGTSTTLASGAAVNGTLTYSTSAFNGKIVKGGWRLEVLGLAGGKLNNWSLSIFG
jgi:hypothetical protein